MPFILMPFQTLSVTTFYELFFTTDVLTEFNSYQNDTKFVKILLK
jgi:hypothetical protein